MKMEGEMISSENIKPCSSTPPEKRIHNLSLLDQIVLPMFVPLVTYYPNFDHNEKNDEIFISQTTQILKQSLSQTLTHFYPLAGRLKDTVSVDCNDEGILFVVVKFDYSLSDFLKKPDPLASRAHIPGEMTWADPPPGSHVAMIQVSYFHCGGIAVGSCVSHRVIDGATMGVFMKAWAAAASSGKRVYPDYTARHLFRQKESLPMETNLSYDMIKYFKTGRTVMRRYVFDASAVSKLRAELVSSTEGGRRPSRVETVSAFMWKCFMVASSAVNNETDDESSAVSFVTQAVNMRRKADPPFSEHSFGNFLWPAPASVVNNQAGRDLKVLFGKVRSAIGKLDADFVKRMQGEDGFSGYSKNLEQIRSEFPKNADFLTITSWCNFGLYDLDFGWGKPTWNTRCDAGNNGAESPFVNVLLLMDMREGDGIEAWLTLDQNYFAEFDKIPELRELASLDPSPLDMMARS